MTGPILDLPPASPKGQFRVKKVDRQRQKATPHSDLSSASTNRFSQLFACISVVMAFLQRRVTVHNHSDTVR